MGYVRHSTLLAQPAPGLSAACCVHARPEHLLAVPLSNQFQNLVRRNTISKDEVPTITDSKLTTLYEHRWNCIG
eukprot:1625680-Amphidinium_carterae.1